MRTAAALIKPAESCENSHLCVCMYVCMHAKHLQASSGSTLVRIVMMHVIGPIFWSVLANTCEP